MRNFFSKAIADTLYQVILVSGVNIKTINDESLLGSGNITISGGGGPGGGIDWGEIGGTLSDQTDLQTALDGKLSLSGGTMGGELDAGSNNIINVGTLSANAVDAATIDATTALTQDGVPVVLTTDARLSDASTITTGTLDDARLSANVARRDQANDFAGQTRTVSGSVGAPGFSFTGDTNTGFYRIAEDRIGIALGGALAFDMQAGAGNPRILFSTGAVGAGTPAWLIQNSVQSLSIWVNNSTQSAHLQSWRQGVSFDFPLFLQSSGGRVSIGNTSDDGTTRLQVAGNISSTGLINTGTYTVSTLPSASANAGREAQVTDSSVTTYRNTVAGGGANRVKVFSDGTNWLVN